MELRLGRGPVPVERIGSQRKGVLPTSDRSGGTRTASRSRKTETRTRRRLRSGSGSPRPKCSDLRRFKNDHSTPTISGTPSPHVGSDALLIKSSSYTGVLLTTSTQRGDLRKVFHSHPRTYTPTHGHTQNLEP